MANFDKFAEYWPDLAGIGQEAEKQLYVSPNTSFMKTRQFIEMMTQEIMYMENLPLQSNQNDNLGYLKRRGIIPAKYMDVFHDIRKEGNKATHDGYDSDLKKAHTALHLALYLVNWFGMRYSADEGYTEQEFIEPAEYRLTSVDEERARAKSLEEREAEIAAAQKKLEEDRKKFEADRPAWREARKSTRAAVARRRKQMEKEGTLNEHQTRVQLIDEKLRAAGWEVDTENLTWEKGVRPQKGRNIAISEVPLALKVPEGEEPKNYRADYVLFAGLQCVGVVEAKKQSLDVMSDLEQAKRYSMAMPSSEEYELVDAKDDFRVPYLYASNGREYCGKASNKSGIWFYDARTPGQRSHAIEAFHSPDDLLKKLKTDVIAADTTLAGNADFPAFAGRDYQIEAVRAVEQALAEGQREIMLSMATGTGKTRVAFSLMHRLLESGRSTSILFLVDRRSLGIQAAAAAASMELASGLTMNQVYTIAGANERGMSLEEPDPAVSIQIATVQSMVKKIVKDKDPAFRMTSYDLVIIDEAHRGYTEDAELDDESYLYRDVDDFMSGYRRVAEFFDAPLVALTATPAKHTTDIFNLPVYEYTYRQAVLDGVLVDHDAPRVLETELSRHGIHYVRGEKVTFFDPKSHTTELAILPEDIDYDVTDFNQKVQTESFNRTVLEQVIEYLPDYFDVAQTKAGKTLIFAARDDHADLIVHILRELYEEQCEFSEGEYTDEAIVKITGRVSEEDRQRLIRAFRNERYPAIAVTVDLLTTGIDVPEISNLVFMRRVKSRILFDQMLGRATRRCDALRKDHFKIFDAVGVYEAVVPFSAMQSVAADSSQSIADIYDEVSTTADALVAEQATGESEGTPDALQSGFIYHKERLVAKIQGKMRRMTDSDRDMLARRLQSASIETLIERIIQAKPQEWDSLQKDIIEFDAWIASYSVSGSDLSTRMAISTKDDDLASDEQRFGEDASMSAAEYLDASRQYILSQLPESTLVHNALYFPQELSREERKNLEAQLYSSNGYTLQQLKNAVENEEGVELPSAPDIIWLTRHVALNLADDDPQQWLQKAQKIAETFFSKPNNAQRGIIKRLISRLGKDGFLAPSAREYFSQGGWEATGGYARIDKDLENRADELIARMNEALYPYIAAPVQDEDTDGENGL